MGQQLEVLVCGLVMDLLAVIREAGEQTVRNQSLKNVVSEQEPEQEVGGGAFGGEGELFTYGQSVDDEIPHESFNWVYKISNYHFFNFLNSALQSTLF